jgi:hypothetical protein
MYKVREQEGRAGPAWRLWCQWKGEEMGKGDGRVNAVQILCAHVCKCKNTCCVHMYVNAKIHVGTVPGMVGEGAGGE